MCSRCVTDDSVRGAFNRVPMIEPWQRDDRVVTAGGVRVTDVGWTVAGNVREESFGLPGR